jgi:hypothetical protein
MCKTVLKWKSSQHRGLVGEEGVFLSVVFLSGNHSIIESIFRALPPGEIQQRLSFFVPNGDKSGSSFFRQQFLGEVALGCSFYFCQIGCLRFEVIPTKVRVATI